MNVHTHTEDRAEVLLRWYKRWLSPVFGNSCRFTPTCSEYSAQAVAEHGWIRGGALAVRRLLRCHPLGAAGFDPVPEPHFAISRFRDCVILLFNREIANHKITKSGTAVAEKLIPDSRSR